MPIFEDDELDFIHKLMNDKSLKNKHFEKLKRIWDKRQKEIEELQKMLDLPPFVPHPQETDNNE